MVCTDPTCIKCRSFGQETGVILLSLYNGKLCNVKFLDTFFNVNV